STPARRDGHHRASQIAARGARARPVNAAPRLLRAARRAGRWITLAYPGHINADVTQFIDEAVDDGWRERGVRGAVRALITVAADALHTRRRPGGFAVQQPSPLFRARRRRPIMESFVDDLRQAWRRLVRTPAFTAIALATLALGIGLTTAVYTVVDQSI